jgi:LysM repeat protein
VKIRRRGRHAAPSQVEKVAGRAVVAAPAVAIAGGVIMGGAGAASAATTPAASVSVQSGADAHAVAHASSVSAKSGRTRSVAHATLDSVTATQHTYDVRSGDTLASIARQVYGTESHWNWIDQDNSSIISDPNLIFPGQALRIPSSAPAVSAPVSSASTSSSGSSSSDASDASDSSDSSDSSSSATTSSTSSSDSSSSAGTQSSATTTSSYSGAESGTLGCSGLEHLWEQAGGNSGEAVMAASIAMAESGGNQYAHSPTDDYGYWQINGSHGSQATYDPIGNAQAAISISGDGSNWSPWSTYTSGAYQGKC